MAEQQTVELSKEEPTQGQQNSTTADDTNQAEQESGQQVEAADEAGAEQTQGGGEEQAEGEGEQQQAEAVEETQAAEEGTQEEAAQETDQQEEGQAEVQEESQQEEQAEGQTEQGQTEQGQTEETAAQEEQADETPAQEEQTEEAQAQQEQTGETPVEEGQTEDAEEGQTQDVAEEQTEGSAAEQTEQEQGGQTQEVPEQTSAEESQGEVPLQNGDVQAIGDLQLPEEEVNSLKRMFNHLSGNGRINFSQFKTLLRLVGQNPTTNDAKCIFDKADRDDDGTIDFEAFCSLYAANRISEEDQEAEIISCINKVFPDNMQRLSLKKVEKIVAQIGLDREESTLAEDDLHKLVSQMDRTGDGEIDRKEFARILVSNYKYST